MSKNSNQLVFIIFKFKTCKSIKLVTMLPKRRKRPLPTADACPKSNHVSTKKAAKKARKETRIESVPKKNNTAIKSTLKFF